MLSKVLSSAVLGIDGYMVHVEVDLAAGLPTMTTVGLPDAAVRESRERVVAAIRNSGFDFPARKVTVNLSPADIKKEGTAFDLPIGVGILAAQGEIPSTHLDQYVLVGELALDGRVRSVKGLLPIALAVRQKGWKGLIFPKENWEEASVIEELDLVPVSTLCEAIQFLKGESRPETPQRSSVIPSIQKILSPDLSDVKGQQFAKRALEVAAAGGHNILMIGPPGSGKTMLAKRMAGILPPLELDEALEVSKIHSVSGLLGRGRGLLSERPFRSPHHTVSDVAIIGGGSNPRPGEISLAHNGILFLDELPEFHRNVLEALRQPLEERQVTVSRAAYSATFPAGFMFIAAMNPCPCGYNGHPEKQCLCTPYLVHKYRSRISGPLLDRIDIHIEVPALKVSELTEEFPIGESSTKVRKRVEVSRVLQRNRFKDEGIISNVQMTSRQLKKYCRIEKEGKELLKSALERLGLSARSYDKILRVSRTIADLAGSERIETTHIGEAIQYRALDRSVLDMVTF